MSEATLGDAATRAIADGVARLLRNDAALRESEQGDGVTRLLRNDVALRESEQAGGRGEERQDRVEDGKEGEPGAIEAVHQMRVATRRLRSDLRTFRIALDPQWAASLRAELGWLADLLGAARDADVLSQRLAECSQELALENARGAAHAGTTPAPGDGQGAAAVMAALAEQRTSAHALLLRALGSDRHQALLERLAQAAQAPALRSSGEAGRPAAETLPPLVLRAWHALEKRVDSLADPPSDDELHGVRISAKRCRYAAEACTPWLGKPTARLGRAAKKLQDVLGELNDAVVAERWLREWASGARSSPADATAAAAPALERSRAAANELAAFEHAAARRARSRWPKAWRLVKSAAPTRG